MNQRAPELVEREFGLYFFTLGALRWGFSFGIFKIEKA